MARFSKVVGIKVEGRPGLIQVGERGITRIVENAPCGEGDKWNYEVHYENGGMDRHFNVTESWGDKEDV